MKNEGLLLFVNTQPDADLKSRLVQLCTLFLITKVHFVVKRLIAIIMLTEAILSI